MYLNWTAIEPWFWKYEVAWLREKCLAKIVDFFFNIYVEFLLKVLNNMYLFSCIVYYFSK